MRSLSVEDERLSSWMVKGEMCVHRRRSAMIFCSSLTVILGGRRCNFVHPRQSGNKICSSSACGDEILFIPVDDEIWPRPKFRLKWWVMKFCSTPRGLHSVHPDQSRIKPSGDNFLGGRGSVFIILGARGRHFSILGGRR